MREYNRAQTELIRDAALNDFQFCFECIFFPGFRLADFHTAGFDDWRWGNANLLLGYTGSAKSTVRHIAYHAWLLLRNRWELQNKMTERPLLTGSGSHNLDAAKSFTSSIKKLLALPAVTLLFGLCVDPAASDTRFNLLGVDYSREKDAAVMAFGAQSGEMAGIHCDILTLDDPVTIEQARSQTQRMNFTEKIAVDIERTLRRPPFYIFGRKREPQFNIIGYPHTSADWYAELQDEQKNPKFKDHITRWPILKDDGTPLWPEFFPLEKCLWIKENTPPHQWLGMYMQKSAASGGDAIRDIWLRWWADEKPPVKLSLYGGVDLNIKQTNTSDFAAVFAWGFDSNTRKRWEVINEAGRWTFDEAINKIKFAFAPYRDGDWQVADIGIDESGTGTYAVEVLKRETDLPVRGVKIVKDKLSRLLAKTHLFEQGKFILKGPARNDVLPGVGDWPAELLSFRKDIQPPPPLHDDRTDAALIADDLIETGDGYLEFARKRLEAIRAEREKATT